MRHHFTRTLFSGIFIHYFFLFASFFGISFFLSIPLGFSEEFFKFFALLFQAKSSLFKLSFSEVSWDTQTMSLHPFFFIFKRQHSKEVRMKDIGICDIVKSKWKLHPFPKHNFFKNHWDLEENSSKDATSVSSSRKEV